MYRSLKKYDNIHFYHRTCTNMNDISCFIGFTKIKLNMRNKMVTLIDFKKLRQYTIELSQHTQIWMSVLSVKFWIGGREIRRVSEGRLGPLMLKQWNILHSGHYLGLKLLYFLSYFLLHNLELLLLNVH